MAGAPTADEAVERSSAYARRTLEALAGELASVGDAAVDPRFIYSAFHTASLDARPVEDDDGGDDDGAFHDDDEQ